MLSRTVTIDSTPGRLEITTTRPSFRIRSEPPDLQIDNQLPQVSVDATEYRSALGFSGSRELTQRTRDEAEEATIAAIAEVAAEGDALGRIENGSAIAAIAAREIEEPPREVQLAFLPPPRIEVENGVRDVVDVVPGTFDLEHDIVPPRFDFQKGSVNVDTEVHNVNVRA